MAFPSGAADRQIERLALRICRWGATIYIGADGTVSLRRG